MALKTMLGAGLVAGLLNFGVSSVSAQVAEVESKPYSSDLLERVRQAATTISGELAATISFTKLAESHRTYAGIIEDGSDDLFVAARTAFQIAYPEGTVMLDSGMDKAVHRYYGFGREEPYWQEANDEVQAALRRAQLIIITHEHGDHVAGVIRSDYREELAAKTMLTKGQVETLTLAPQLPEIQLTSEQASDYNVVDYELLLPVAPGIVLIKSPGHTPGHQMVYVQLAQGKEFLFIGDIAWSLDNITQLKLRPAETIARIKENPQALMHQMTWIKHVMDEDGLVVVPSHDQRLLARYVEEGILGASISP
ncbi:MAG: MBL fold metallo-hydrolase [Proteobacteria bacterium]|nr:MBL fold metallo-hydrolase [Pseudomonadota bacterium]